MHTSYALIETVKAGDVLIADSGFTCLPLGAEREVVDVRGDLCVGCVHGWHAIDGQASNGRYVGFWRKQSAVRPVLALVS